MNDDADSRAALALTRLLGIMRRLRAPDGCPWDREQDFQSIAPYTIEEAYEVAEAISQATSTGQPGGLQGELGDLLFQVVFHAQMGSERCWFDFASIADSITGKLIERHPHVFAGADRGSSAELNRAWEEHKARERAARAGESREPASELADVPLALPALARAAKLGKRAGRVGFDWTDARGVRDKIEEELREIEALEREPAAQLHTRRSEELGDLLFAVANWARHQRVDPEEALRLANAKFERRFRAMERLAAERSLALGELTAEGWEALWSEVKTAEK
jgi:ATP diphosphatase